MSDDGSTTCHPLSGIALDPARLLAGKVGYYAPSPALILEPFRVER